MSDIPGITTLEDKKTQVWTTTHGDTVTIWQSARLGEVMNWRWRVRAKNGEIVGSGEGHTRRRKAREAALRHHPVAATIPEGVDREDYAHYLAWVEAGRPRGDEDKPVAVEADKLCFYDNFPCGKQR